MATWGDWKQVLAAADIDTARLIVQLQLEDSHKLAQIFYRTPDAVLAERLLRAELKKLQAELPSRQRGEDLEDAENEREQAYEEAAFGWSFDEWADEPHTIPDPPKYVPCTACTEGTDPNDIVEMPCGHKYCKDCLESLYYGCITDETLFPPRCCHKEFPYELVKHHLSQRCRSLFGQKRVELETKDRTYCYEPTCSAFIDPAGYVRTRYALCMRCAAITCVDCKGPGHVSTACPKDETTDAVLQVAAKNEWQRCYGCRCVVELKHGCNHITCVCKSQFCYQCGTPWKNCTCDQWDEERLVEQAEAVADLESAQPEETQAGRQVRVQQAAEHLRTYHECAHERFKGIREHGAKYRCEVCTRTYKTWIYQCRQCLMVACNTCRRHRL